MVPLSSLSSFAALTSLVSAAAGNVTPAPPPDVTPLLRSLERKSIDYFLDHMDPESGLVRDRALNFDDTPDSPRYRMASLAATGFGLAVLANAAERGLVDKSEAQSRIERSLDFVETRLFDHHGWLYHFVDIHTGERFEDCEVSTIDTTLFLAGALYAAQVFPQTALAQTAERLYERADFIDMMTDGHTRPLKRTLSMGWKPKGKDVSGRAGTYLRAQWDSYSELLLLLLLGLGHPTHPLPVDTWEAFHRPVVTAPDGRSVIGGDLPLFVHQYSQLFIDFRGRVDAHADYFQNSVEATLANRAAASEDESTAGLLAPLWGLSASDSPDGYRIYSPQSKDGTYCPGCAVASMVFTPAAVFDDLRSWVFRGAGGRPFVGRYGFADGIRPESAWVDTEVLGITVGPLYLAIADLDFQTSVWRRFTQIPAVLRGLARAGLTLPSEAPNAAAAEASLHSASRRPQGPGPGAAGP